MSRVKALLEDTEVVSLLEDNQELIAEAGVEFEGWYDTLVNYISENIDEMLGDSLDDTMKNVRTFCSFSTSQFLAETSYLYGTKLHDAEILAEAEAHEFL